LNTPDTGRTGASPCGVQSVAVAAQGEQARLSTPEVCRRSRKRLSIYRELGQRRQHLRRCPVGLEFGSGVDSLADGERAAGDPQAACPICLAKGRAQWVPGSGRAGCRSAGRCSKQWHALGRKRLKGKDRSGLGGGREQTFAVKLEGLVVQALCPWMCRPWLGQYLSRYLQAIEAYVSTKLPGPGFQPVKFGSGPVRFSNWSRSIGSGAQASPERALGRRVAALALAAEDSRVCGRCLPTVGYALSGSSAKRWPKLVAGNRALSLLRAGFLLRSAATRRMA